MKPRHASQTCRQIGDYLYEIPQAFRADMRVPAHFYADDEHPGESPRRPLARATGQHRDPARRRRPGAGHARHPPGLRLPHRRRGRDRACRMASSRPGGVGYDINCGVRLLGIASGRRTRCVPHLRELADALYRHLPSGVGVKGHLHINKSRAGRDPGRRAASGRSARRLCPPRGRRAHRGSAAAWPAPTRTRSARAPRSAASSRWARWARATTLPRSTWSARSSMPRPPRRFGLRLGQVVFQIHCGSRGLGHQVATDYIQELPERPAALRLRAARPPAGLRAAGLARGPELPGAMNCAANYAWANRQVLTYRAREAFEEVLRGQGPRPRPVPDLRCGAQHGQDRDAHGRWPASCRCASTARAPRAPSARAIPTCRPTTARSASRCWCRAAWARRPTSWSAPQGAWSTPSARAATAPGA